MKFNKILIAGCGLLALGATGMSYAQIHCPESITCSSDSPASCKSPDPNWQASTPMVTVKANDTFQFIYAYYLDGAAKCGYKRTNDNSITLSTEATKSLAPAKSSGWPPALNGGARSCGSPNNPQSAGSCPWEAK